MARLPWSQHQVTPGPAGTGAHSIDPLHGTPGKTSVPGRKNQSRKSANTGRAEAGPPGMILMAPGLGPITAYKSPTRPPCGLWAVGSTV